MNEVVSNTENEVVKPVLTTAQQFVKHVQQQYETMEEDAVSQMENNIIGLKQAQSIIRDYFGKLRHDLEVTGGLIDHLMKFKALSDEALVDALKGFEHSPISPPNPGVPPKGYPKG